MIVRRDPTLEPRPLMNAIVDPAGPQLAVVPSNPVPEGARVGYFTTSDKVRLRYATFPKGPGAPRGTVSSPLVSLRVRLMRQPGKGGAAGVPQRSGRPGRQRRALGGRVGVGLGTGAQSGASIGAAVAGE